MTKPAYQTTPPGRDQLRMVGAIRLERRAASLRCTRAASSESAEQFPIDRFRDLLGVPPDKLTRGPDFERRVIEPALLEVNGLSDMGVQIKLTRVHARAPITGVTLAWWRKERDEFRAAYAERQRSKAGRMARLRGKVEAIVPANVLAS